MTQQKATILIVDDMQTNIAILANMLSDLYTIKVAKSGEKALEILSHGDVDLVLLDVVMPVMDGYEVCKIIKNDKKTRDIPIIFVTGNTSKEDEERGFNLGAVDYITKPSTPSTVRARVNAHINLYFRKKELERLTKITEEQNEQLSRYTNVIDQYVITSSTDLDGIITYVSEAFCEISGYAKEELIGQKQSIVKHPDMTDSFFKELWETITEDKTWEGEIKNLKKDGGYYWVKAYITPDFKDGEKIGYTAVRQDITDKKRIEEISITDGLTDVYNRRHFNEIFPKVINSAKRDDTLVSFLLLDIDHFKPYNDNYGHQEGDSVLQKFAKCLKDSLHRADDMVFRLGGEEFGVIFKAETKEKALEFANTLRESIENLKIEHEYSSASSFVTASMGLFCKNASSIDSMDEAYKEADDLLYEAKKAGRNQVKADIS
jgi:diguanylate cyclase (GGDEF)-like protein/PAS domain S-box-containing protein